MHSENAPYKLEKRLVTFFFFLNKLMFEKDIGEKQKGKCAAIKKPSTGRVFEFFTVFIYVEKKDSSVWRLRCAISMELLTLVCVCNIFTSTADLVLPRCFLMADWTCLCTWQRRTNTYDWYDDLMMFYCIPLFHSHLCAILERQSALCSIASLYGLVHDLHCCKELCQK